MYGFSEINNIHKEWWGSYKFVYAYCYTCLYVTVCYIPGVSKLIAQGDKVHFRSWAEQDQHLLTTLKLNIFYEHEYDSDRIQYYSKNK